MMILKSIKYSQHLKSPHEWTLAECMFGDVGLIVGRNAAGKTRILNVISGLAKLMAGESPLRFRSGRYDVVFEDEGAEIQYVLAYEEQAVLEEKMTEDGNVLLERGSDGIANIYTADSEDLVPFQPPINELAVVNRRDPIQHPFFERLYDWGRSVHCYHFGTKMGQDHLAVFVSGKPRGKELDLSDENMVVAVFRKGQETLGDPFTQQIIQDMERIGYELDSISLETIEARVSGHVPEVVNGIQVIESDLRAATPHINISSGMFRALSLLIHVNFVFSMAAPRFVMIDDIGEGLDYARSTALIELLISKATAAGAQLIMSTNNRFVMNVVPLENWLLVRRSGHDVRVHDYHNSRELFDDFESTGLSNFDFFSSDYLPED